MTERIDTNEGELEVEEDPGGGLRIASAPVDPCGMLVETACRDLFFGKEYGPHGMSPFGAVLVIGAYYLTDGKVARRFAAASYHEEKHTRESRKFIIERLEQVLADLKAPPAAFEKTETQQ